MGPKKVTWHFNSVVTWQFENVIFPQPQVLWPPNLAGYVLRLRGRLAQSQMTLLFRGHVTKTSFSLLFSLSHCLWSVGLAKDERTSLKKFTIHVTLPPLDKLKTLCLIFLVQSNSNWLFTLLTCIPTVHKPIRLKPHAFRISIFLQVFGLIKHFLPRLGKTIERQQKQVKDIHSFANICIAILKSPFWPTFEKCNFMG